MRILDLYDKLKQSPEFQQFITKPEYKNAYPLLVFFVFDSNFKLELKQFDFFVPETKHIVNFVINDKVVIKMNEPNSEDKDKSFVNIDKDIKDLVGTNELVNIIKENVKNTDRIIAILHEQERRIVFTVNCMSGFNIKNLTIDAKTGQIIKKSDVSLIKHK